MAASFRNDYSYLAHQSILDALASYQKDEHTAYGLDKHSEIAAGYIKKIFGSPKGEVHFLAGGTQTNMTFITYCLKHYEGVISCDTGHINVHETAAVEGAGHKIITVKNHDGKLCVEDIKAVLANCTDEHMVKPGMVYISNSTELGTIYTKKELEDLYAFCKKARLYLFIDGARLAVALTAKDNDVEPKLLGKVCDAFYVGGTKNGLLFGEALVINNPELQNNFRYHIKNRGAMLAKGFAAGIQFEEAFKDGLYFKLGEYTNGIADELKRVLKAHNMDMLPSPTNQIFVSCDKKVATELMDKFKLEKWSENDDKITVRFVTCFMNTMDDVAEVDRFLNTLK